MSIVIIETTQDCSDLNSVEIVNVEETGCSCEKKSKDCLLRENYLGEFDTFEEKQMARNNLDVYSKEDIDARKSNEIYVLPQAIEILIFLLVNGATVTPEIIEQYLGNAQYLLDAVLDGKLIKGFMSQGSFPGLEALSIEYPAIVTNPSNGEYDISLGTAIESYQGTIPNITKSEIEVYHLHVKIVNGKYIVAQATGGYLQNELKILPDSGVSLVNDFISVISSPELRAKYTVDYISDFDPRIYMVSGSKFNVLTRYGGHGLDVDGLPTGQQLIVEVNIDSNYPSTITAQAIQNNRLFLGRYENNISPYGWIFEEQGAGFELITTDDINALFS